MSVQAEALKSSVSSSPLSAHSPISAHSPMSAHSKLPESSKPIVINPSSRVDAIEVSAPPLHVASIVIHVRPEYLPAMKTWLASFSSAECFAEVHAESEQGKLVVVAETEDEQNILALLDAVREQRGALSSALVYHEIIHEEGQI